MIYLNKEGKKISFKETIELARECGACSETIEFISKLSEEEALSHKRMSEWACWWCENVYDYEEMWRRIVESNNAYWYCRWVKDRKEVRDRIVDDEYAYSYCSRIKDRKEVRDRIKHDGWIEQYNYWKEETMSAIKHSIEEQNERTLDSVIRAICERLAIIEGKLDAPKCTCNTAPEQKTIEITKYTREEFNKDIDYVIDLLCEDRSRWGITTAMQALDDIYDKLDNCDLTK